MIPYVFFIIIIIFFLFIKTNSRQTKTQYQLIALLIIISLAILRFDVGFDYKAYYGFVAKNNFESVERFEPLCRLIFYIALYFKSPFILFTLFGLLTYSIMFASLKKMSVSPSFSIVVYLSLFYLFSLGALRQALAMSVCLYSYRYLYRQSFGKFLIIICVASLFHYSAVISVIIYFIYKIRVKHVMICVLVFFACKEILYYIIITYTKYGLYIVDNDDLSGGRFKQFFFILLFLSLLFVVRYRNFNMEEKRLLSIVVVGSAFPFLLGTAIGDRVALYFYIYYCYLIPLLLNNKKYTRISLCYIVLLISYFLFYIAYTTSVNELAPYVPYKSILNSTANDFRF